MTTEDKGGAGIEEKTGKQGTLPETDAKHQDELDETGRSKWIPRARFDELVDQVRDLKGKLEIRIEPKTEPKELSRAELAVAVEKGELTQDQANTLWERQFLKRTEDAAREVATQVVTASQTTSRIDAEMRRYKELIPNVMRDGTEDREKVADEYRHLVSVGHPENRTTELAALRVVYGPVEKIEKARQSKHDVQSDEQTGGGEQAAGGTEKVKGLTTREREYYTDQIAKGRYKDWDAVKEELTYANKALRAKMGVKA